MNTFTNCISQLLSFINETDCVLCKVQDEAEERVDEHERKNWTQSILNLAFYDRRRSQSISYDNL